MEQDQLNEFDSKEIKTPKDFYAAIIFLSSYIVFVVLTFFIDVDFKLLKIDWSSLIVVLCAPMLSLPLLIKVKKSGWVLSTSYFVVMVLLFMCSLARRFYLEGYEYLQFRYSWKLYLFELFSMPLTVLLVSKNNRNFFKVSNPLFVRVLIIGIIIATSFLILMLVKFG